MLQLLTSVSRMALLLTTLTPSSAANPRVAASGLGMPAKSRFETAAAAPLGSGEALCACAAAAVDSFSLLALALGERLQLPVPPSWLLVVALSLRQGGSRFKQR